MAYRAELEEFVGKTIPFEAMVKSRADGGKYGFLLNEVTTPNGKIDHIWLQIHDLDLAEMSGHWIRGTARVDTYLKDCRIDGRYVEDGEEGIGFSDISDVEVLLREWTPLEDAATKRRKSRISKIKQAKLDGNYIYPGKWAQSNGSWMVRAAKSAPSGSRCHVTASNPWYSRDVILTAQASPGNWRFSEIQAEKPAEAAAA